MPPWQYECPYGHRGLEFGVTVAYCRACRANGRNSTYKMNQLTDLAVGTRFE